MLYVLLAATCSVLVSVLLKIARKRGIDIAQAITWNYLAASALCFFMLKPPLESLQHAGTPWASLLALAIILPSLFVVLAVSVRAAGIVRTDIAQRLSLLLSLAAAFLFFAEHATPLKLAGLALGLIAVVGILARPAPQAAPGDSRMWPALLTVWIGFALVDILLKRISAAGTPFAASLQVSFALAFAGMLAWQGVRVMQARTQFTARNLAAGLLLGLVNFGNIIFYVMAHRALPGQPAVIFASMNVGVVVLGTLVGVAGFGEKLSGLNRAAIALAIVSICLIAAAPRG